MSARDFNPVPFEDVWHGAQRLRAPVNTSWMHTVTNASIWEGGEKWSIVSTNNRRSGGSVELPVLLMLFNYAVKRFVFLCNDQLSDVSDNSEWWSHAAPALICSYRSVRNAGSEHASCAQESTPVSLSPHWVCSRNYTFVYSHSSKIRWIVCVHSCYWATSSQFIIQAHVIDMANLLGW